MIMLGRVLFVLTLNDSLKWPWMAAIHPSMIVVDAREKRELVHSCVDEDR